MLVYVVLKCAFNEDGFSSFVSIYKFSRDALLFCEMMNNKSAVYHYYYVAYFVNKESEFK